VLGALTRTHCPLDSQLPRWISVFLFAKYPSTRGNKERWTLASRLHARSNRRVSEMQAKRSRAWNSDTATWESSETGESVSRSERMRARKPSVILISFAFPASPRFTVHDFTSARICIPPISWMARMAARSLTLDVFPRHGVIGSTRSRGVDLADLPRISSLLFFFLSPRGSARANNDENLPEIQPERSRIDTLRRIWKSAERFSFANCFTYTAYAI